MGTPIQEPNQIDPSTITDETAGNFALVCYEKRSDGAGLKTLGLAPWKTFMNYNGFKVDNIAALAGFSKAEYNKDYEITVPEEDTLKYKLNCIKLNAGVEDSISDPPAVPLSTRVSNLETTVGTPSSGSDPATALCLAVETNTQSISDLWDVVGEDTPGTNNLSTRMTNAENDIDQLQNEVEAPDTGLIAIVGDSNSGLVKDVSQLMTDVETAGTGIKDVVGDSNSGLVKDVSDLKTTVGGSTSGLVHNVESLQTTVGDNDNGLVKDVSTLKDIVGEPATPSQYNTGTGMCQNVNNLLIDVNNLQSKVDGAYIVKGDVNQGIADGWKSNNTYATFEQGWAWNVKATSPATTVKIQIPKTDNTYEEVYVDDGVNIVWVKSELTTYKYGTFDQLTDKALAEKVASLDEDINDSTNGLKVEMSQAQTNITNLQNLTWSHEGKRKTSGSGQWSSGDEDPSTVTGIFQITGRNSGGILISCVVFLDEGKCYTPANDIITTSANGTADYTTLFRVNDALGGDNTIEALGSALAFNIRRIGGIS